MPPFILLEYRHPLGRPPQKIIFTKNEYSHGVKMPEWDRLKESEPKDYDPYNPPGGNQFLSTYNRIGQEKEDEHHFDTITRESYKNILYKDKVLRKSDKRPMIHHLTFKVPCVPQEPRRCPISEDCVNDYLSTTHDSYKIPNPCVLQPLTIPKKPFLQNRKLKWEQPELDDNKFFDDCYIPKVKKLQTIKGFRTVSYDPILQKFSDGTSGIKKPRKCVKLPFDHVK